MARYLLTSKFEISVQLSGIVVVESSESGEIGKTRVCRIERNSVGDVSTEREVIEDGTILIWDWSIKYQMEDE